MTRGPSLVPGEKRLAVHTEDHPLDYLTFEGVIPKGEYGGGTMIVWDQGRWTPLADPRKGYAKGHLDFELHGERLKGRWHLVRMRPRPREKRAMAAAQGRRCFRASAWRSRDLAEVETTSVISGQTNADLAASGEVRRDHADRAQTKSQGEAFTQARPRLGSQEGAAAGLLGAEPCGFVREGPVRREWIHEIKFDGYRLQARIDGKGVKLLTRKGLDWTKKFEPIGTALQALGLGSALFDGEVVVEDEAGVRASPRCRPT